MEGRYKFKKLDWYPHMKPLDTHLWEEFIGKYPDFLDSVDYDVLVGEGMVFGDPATDQYARSFQMLTQKKIDAVGYKGSKVYIIEIKPNAGPTPLGQLFSYTQLWKKQHPEETNVAMLIITNEPQSDFEDIYSENGIELIKLGYCTKCAVPANFGH